MDSLFSKADSHIGIAGAGLLGRIIAWKLLKQGHRVTLFDAGTIDSNGLDFTPSAAHTAAGMIAPLSEAVSNEKFVYAMGMSSLQLWPDWLEELKADTGQTVSFSKKGSLLVAHPQDHQLLKQFIDDLQRLQLTDVNVGLMTAKQIEACEPSLGDRFQQGLFLQPEAHIDNRQLLQVLLNAISINGGQCVPHTRVHVSAYKITSSERQYTFDRVYDCRGCGAKPQWSQLRGVRGELMRVHSNEIKLARPVRLMHPRYQLYIVPKSENQFVIGATQIESEDRSPISIRSSLELSSALYTINPAFSEARILESAVNLRPALNDNRPKIRFNDGLVEVNGLYRHGFLLAPVVVDHLMKWQAGISSLPFADELGLTTIGEASGYAENSN